MYLSIAHWEAYQDLLHMSINLADRWSQSINEMADSTMAACPGNAQPTPAYGDSHATMNACWADALAGEDGLGCADANNSMG